MNVTRTSERHENMRRYRGTHAEIHVEMTAETRHMQQQLLKHMRDQTWKHMQRNVESR